MKKIIELYNYKDLDKDIQEKLIEKEIEYQKNDFCEWYLYEDMESIARELLRNTFNDNISVNNVYYDLSYCQGCGSMIEFDISIEDLNNKYKFLTDEELRLIKDKGLIDIIKIRHNDSSYYHEYAFNINYDFYNCWSYEDIKDDYKLSEEDYNLIEEKINILLDSYTNKHYSTSPFINDIININHELTKEGYQLIEDDDNFKMQAIEYLKEQNNLYYKDGTLFTHEYTEIEEV